MVREDLIAWGAGLVMSAGGFGFGWFIMPEPAELKLLRIQTNLDYQAPKRRTLPPDTKIVDCVMMWIGGPGGEPEIWCPPVPPEEPQRPAVPTS